VPHTSGLRVGVLVLLDAKGIEAVGRSGRRRKIRFLSTFDIVRPKISSVIVKRRVMIPRVPHTSSLRVGVLVFLDAKGIEAAGWSGRRCTIRFLHTYESVRPKIPSMIVERSVTIPRVPHTSGLRVGILVLLYAEEIEALLRQRRSAFSYVQLLPPVALTRNNSRSECLRRCAG
jgi:hypothetical protein